MQKTELPALLPQLNETLLSNILRLSRVREVASDKKTQRHVKIIEQAFQYPGILYIYRDFFRHQRYRFHRQM
jgi:hypothetical protein